MLSGAPGGKKSSFTLHWAAHLVLGKPFARLKSTGPVSVLYLQNEDTEDDLAAVIRGIMRQLNPTKKQCKMLEENLYLRTVLGLSGDRFIDMLAEQLKSLQPDIVVMDPLFAFMGADAVSQVMVTDFLRNQMAPLLRKYRCGWICVHHNKKERQGSPDGTKAYGSIEFSAYFRGIMELGSLKTGEVKLDIVKRARQADIRDDHGGLIHSVLLASGTDEITWDVCAAQPSSKPTFQKAVGLAKPTGRPAKAAKADLAKFVAGLRSEKATDAEITMKIEHEFDVTARHARRLLAQNRR